MHRLAWAASSSLFCKTYAKAFFVLFISTWVVGRCVKLILCTFRWARLCESDPVFWIYLSQFVGVPRRQPHRRYFRPGNPALCGSRPLVTPYYCRLRDLLWLFVYPLFVYYFVYVCVCVFCVFFVFFVLFSFAAFSFSTLMLLVGSFDL